MDYTARENNNFNLIRMLAAYMVIMAHATAIQGKGVDLVAQLTGQTHSGQMAVFVFTFLSGIFITKSVIKSKDTTTFFKKRILRLYPELIICLLLILILGSCFTTYSQYDYWKNPQTIKYFIANLLEVVNEHILPGVFENHPAGGSMNGVLWYITFEIRIYLLWALLKSLKIFEDKNKANIVLLILFVWITTNPASMPFLGSDIALYGSDVFPQYTITFILAALVYLNVETLEIKWWHICVSVIIMWIFRHSLISTWIWGTGFILASLWIGTSEKIRSIRVKDLSYGIFLYGWPMGQLVYEILPNASSTVAAILTICMATFMAIISEKLISFIICLAEKMTNKFRREGIVNE